jgi:UDP-N-acetylmuramoyl-L-alanyl-D-glutamate--2,6-diaminopimelate ligase
VGVEHDVIQSAIPLLRPRWGRLEEVETASKARVFVDYAHTDDALRNVLSTVRKFTSGKVWAVFGAGGDRDPMKRPLMGKAAAETADVLVVTSDNPRSEDPESIISQIAAGIGETEFIVEPDRRKAIFYALSNADANDTVVVCGKGHETTQEVKGVKYPFDDREVCKEFC